MLQVLALYDLKRMALKVNLKQFLNEKGEEAELTDQAKVIFNFLSKIVLSVSQNIEQPLTFVDLKCNTRAEGLICE